MGKKFPPTTRSRILKQGFTLIEMLLVVALLGLLFANVLPKVSNMFRVNVQSSVRRFGSMVRYAYDEAIFTGKLHRIVLNLDDQTWGVETANPGELPVDKARRQMSSFANKLNDKDAPSGEPGFQKIRSAVAIDIPKGVRIVSVKSWRLGDAPVTKGTVSIYAYPSGLMDEATVRLAEQDNAHAQSFDIKIQPLTGRVKVEVERAK